MTFKMNSKEINPNIINNTVSADIIEISDHEEGEIPSDLDEISDISSDEEFLLRQRIEILENYNSVLEKKEAKRFTHRKDYAVDLHQSRPLAVDSDSLSNISSGTFDNEVIIRDVSRNGKSKLGKRKKKSRKPSNNRKTLPPKKDIMKRSRRRGEKSSSDSDIEKTVQKRILRKVVNVFTPKTDKSSLKTRLLNLKMIKNTASCTLTMTANPQEESNVEVETAVVHQSVDVNDSEKVALFNNIDSPLASNDASLSDEDDPEVLRQLALKSKSTKLRTNKQNVNNGVDTNVQVTVSNEQIILEDSADSDIEALRLIALKSAVIKKAMERKKRPKNQKKKIKARKSISSNIFSDDAFEEHNLNEELHNTDIETIDMEIDQDAVDLSPRNISQTSYELYLQQNQFVNNNTFLLQQNCTQNYQPILQNYQDSNLYFGDNIFISNDYLYNDIDRNNVMYQNQENVFEKQDDIEEDEEILRAQLLTAMNSTSKPLLMKEAEPVFDNQNATPQPPTTNLIIKLGDSDSESECEATKNLEKMHKKLSDQSEFQKNLDAYLKSFRLQANTTSQSFEKNLPAHQTRHTPMALKHLPESHQREYKSLIKRMAEIENAKLTARMQTSEIHATPNHNKMVKSGESISSAIRVIPKSHVIQDNVDEKLPYLAQPNEDDVSSKLNSITENFFRQKIESQTKMIQQLVEEERKLNIKYENEMNQLRAIKASMRDSERAMRLNNKSQQITHNSLLKLRKQHNTLRQRVKASTINKKINLIKNNCNNLTNKLKVTAAKVELKSMKSSENTNQKHVPQKSDTTLNTVNEMIHKKPEKSKPLENQVTKSSNIASINQKNMNDLHTVEYNDNMKATFDVENKEKNTTNGIEPKIKLETVQNSKHMSNKCEVIEEVKHNPLNLEQEQKIINSNTCLQSKLCNILEDKQNDITIFNEIETNEHFTKTVVEQGKISSDQHKNSISKNDVEDTTLSVSLDDQNNRVLSANMTEEKYPTVPDCDNSCNVMEISEKEVKSNVKINDEVNDEDVEINGEDVKSHVEVNGTTENYIELVMDQEENLSPTDIISKEDSKEVTIMTIDEVTGTVIRDCKTNESCTASTDYESPLRFLDHNYSWTSETQSIFCPFEVAGSCRDEHCKYFHPNL